MERDWTSEQRELFKVKLKESLRKNNRDGFADTLLKKCKEHDGPISSIDDLTKLLGKYDEESLKKILRQEIQYHKVFQARDSQERPDIYKVNNLSVEDMSNNLMLMFSHDETSTSILFQSQEEIMTILKGQSTTQVALNYCFQQPLAVVWDIGDQSDWYIGFFLDENSNENTIQVDHMEKQSKDHKGKWIRPRLDDIQDVKEQQILPCKVMGEWDFSFRTAVFIIQNAPEIQARFDELFSI